jgi:3-oxoacid CoA-transferase B subunit
MEQDIRLRIARRAAAAIRDGEVVNLGVGIPTLIADVIGDRPVYLHSENGILGFGPPPPSGEEDEDLVDAGKRPVTEVPGMAYFDSALSFAMVRGGHLDCAVMGALQVDQEGAVANWTLPGGRQLGVGGAMDLLVGARRLIITMTLTDNQGRPKLVRRCSLPVTGHRVPDLVVTESAVFGFVNGRLTLLELDPQWSVEDLRQRVEAEFAVAPKLEPLAV